MNFLSKYIMAAVMLLLSACGATSAPVSDGVLEPGDCGVTATADAEVTGAGPFRVGFRSVETVYQPPGVEDERTIRVNIWYPSQDEEGNVGRYINLYPDAEVMTDASLAPPLSNCGYPLLVYSHGHQGFGGTAAHMMRAFASHGWVAIAPDHTGNLITDNLDPRPIWMYYVRSLDISHSLDVIETLPDEDPLANSVATDRVVMSGHSFGSMTVWASAGASFDMDRVAGHCTSHEGEAGCSPAQLEVFAGGLRDDRVVAAIPLTNPYTHAWFGDTGYESVDIPFLHMTGSEDDVGAPEQWDRLQDSDVDLTWIELEGGCHETFAMGTLFCPTPEDGGEYLDEAEGFRIVNAYALSLARHHVLGDDRPAILEILNGDASLSPVVTFRRNHK